MATWYVDLEGSAGAANGTSFANRSSSLASIVNAAGNGDVVRVKASADPTSIGTATWTKNSTVSISSSLVKEIYNDGAWTGATNVTATANVTNTARKEGASSSQLVIATAFVTGKIAYFPLGSTQDFSAYNKVSFWFRTSVAATAASTANYRLALCSDALGDVVVDSLSFPSMQLAANYMCAITLDKGSALGSSIQSVALYRDNTDPGTPTLIIDNMFATNNIALNTIISNSINNEWFSIRSIVGTTVTLDQGVATANVTAKGYPNNTTTAESFISEGFLITPVSTAATYHFTITKTAVSGSTVTISGGWNRTDMSTQTGVTHINSRNFLGRLFNLGGAFLEVEKFMHSFADTSILINGSNHSVRNCFAVGLFNDGIIISGTRTVLSLDNVYVSNCSQSGLTVNIPLTTITNCKSYNCGTYGMSTNGNFTKISTSESKNNVSSGFAVASAGAYSILNCTSENNSDGIDLSRVSNASIRNCQSNNNTACGLTLSEVILEAFNFSTSGNATASINDNSNIGVLAYLFNWNKTESTPVANLNTYDNGFYISVNDNGSPTTHITYTDNGRISSETGVKYSSTGISWKHQPTTTVRPSNYPLTQDIKGIPLKANVSHEISIQARRDNTGISFTFGYEDQGVSGLSAVSTSLSSVANTWEKLSLTLTPTIDCIVDLYTSSYGGTSFTAYWDDFQVVASSKNNVSNGDYGYYLHGVYVTNQAPSEFAYSFIN